MPETQKNFYKPVQDKDVNIQGLIYDGIVPQYMEGLITGDAIGRGGEKIVYAQGEERIAAFFALETTVSGLKREFYERKLAATLLPGYVPDVHMAASKPPLLVVDRVIGMPIIDTSSKMHSELAKKITERKFKELGVRIDTHPSNFILSKKGLAVYVDSIGIKPWDIMGIEAAIDDLPRERQIKARTYLGRFLAQEAKVSSQPTATK